MIYSRYILNKTFVAFAAILSILISLIWFSRAIGFVRYVTENGVGLSQFFYLFVLILPWLMIFIIPISLFVATLLIYNRLNLSNEITILKNSGLTNFQISRPAIFLAIICSFFCFTLSLYFMPFANKELRLSRNNIQDNYANLSFNPQTFETLKELTIYAKNRDENDRLYGILLHDERSFEYSLTITAKTGKIISENNSVLLYMEDGTIQKFNRKSDKSEILNFDNYVFNLSENQKSSSSLRWKPKERYLAELLYPEDAEEDDYEKFRAEIHSRFTYPLLPLVFSLIALAFILRGQFSRHGNLKNIVLSIMVASLFLVLTITCYDLIETSKKFIPLLYLNLIAFIWFSLRVLTRNPNIKK